MPSDLSPDALVVHRESLYRAARKLCTSTHDADDLVQDTYVGLLRRRRRLQTSGADLGYMLRALHNTHVSSVRKHRRQPQPIETASHEGAAASAVSPATVMLAREIVRAIATLPIEQRRTLTAVDVMGLSYSEAANALDTPIGTVMSRLYRARERLVAAISA